MQFVLIMLAAGLPWLVALAWLLRRHGWSLLWSRPDGRALPSQAEQLRAFGARR